MLKQVLQQNASKPEAKSKQSQRQTLSSHLPVFGMPVETPIHFVTYVPEPTTTAWMGESR